MANAPVPLSRFEAYYSTTADPYGQRPELLQDTYAPVVALTNSLYGTTTSSTYPLAFLVGGTGGRIYPVLMPFDQLVLPGQGTPRKYALIGDVSPHGTLPTIIEITNDFFHITGNQPVPAINDMA